MVKDAADTDLRVQQRRQARNKAGNVAKKGFGERAVAEFGQSCTKTEYA